MRIGKLAMAVMLSIGCFAEQQGPGTRPAESGISGSTMLVYKVTLQNPAEHRAHVELRDLAPAGGVVQLPVWNALYQVRDFSQYVESFHATDMQGHPVPAQKIDKTTWSAPGANKIEYDIVLDTPGPYSAQLNGDHGFLNLAQVLMYVADARRNWPVTIFFQGLPAGWKIATVLNRRGDMTNQFFARNYDALVDAPVEIGKFSEISFEEGGGKYRIAIDAAEGDYDPNKVRENVRKIARAEVAWMDDRPCGEYLFIYHFPRVLGGGGMEHSCSTAIDVPAERMSASMNAFDSVTAHEFFHLWNVKRIRPQSLEPVDYTREQYTRALWFSEGVTSTIEGYVLLRAGLTGEGEYLRKLASEIAMLQGRPAHLTQSVEESSLDTWYDKYAFYRRPERSISYYNKGEVLGVMLDLAIRESTSGMKSLRDVFRWMNENYARRGRFFDDSEGVRTAVEAITSKDFKWFFQSYVSGTEEIPYDRFLNTAGLQLAVKSRTIADIGFFASRNFDGPPVVTDVTVGSNAEAAGLRAGDTVLSVNGSRSGNVEEVARGISAGEKLHLKVQRRGDSKERELTFQTGRREVPEYSIIEVEHPSSEQRARRAQWLEQPRKHSKLRGWSLEFLASPQASSLIAPIPAVEGAQA